MDIIRFLRSLFANEKEDEKMGNVFQLTENDSVHQPTVSDNSKLFDRKQNIEFPEISCDAIFYLSGWGQVRTLADIAKALNEKFHFANIDDFFSSFKTQLDEYLNRGTVTLEAVDVLSEIILQNREVLFKDYYLDLEKLLDLISHSANDDKNNPFNVIYSKREKTKLLRLAVLLNDVVRYTSADKLNQDVCSIASGKYHNGNQFVLNDSFHYPLYFFNRGVENLWNSIISDGFLDNELLEKKMFTEHEQKVANFGLEHVLETDYENDAPCHPEVMFPKEIGTGPVYVKDSFYTDFCSGKNMYVKSCGEGKGPNAHPTLYEFKLIRPILDRECQKGEYYFIDDYYIPMKDEDKPVFYIYHGQVRFDDQGGEKCDFIERMKLEIEKNENL